MDTIERLRNALTELRANKHVFSDEAYSLIVQTLVERIRAHDNPDSLPSTTDADSIRLVSVMFIDVQNSTEMAQALGAEVWREIIADAHNKLSTIIGEREGEIGQYLGDGLLCFFGAHHSRGDDALQAVACALAIQRAVKAYAQTLSQRFETLSFAVRIGIATGRVVVGMVGGEAKKEFLALGPTTNLASRIQAICPPDDILIDVQTYRRVRNHFMIEPQEPAQLKGFDAPVETFRVLEQRRQPPARLTPARIEGVHMPFVGRDAERQTILTQYHKAYESRCFNLVMVSGDIGIGKSRLLQEISHVLADGPNFQLTMSAHYDHRLASYNLLRDLIARYGNLTEDTSPEVARRRITNYVTSTWADPQAESVAAVMGYLAGYGFEDSPPVQPLKRGGRPRERMAFAWLARWLQGLATPQPLLIIVDNFQWADSASQDLIAYLLHSLQDSSGLMLIATRPDFFIAHPDYLSDYPARTDITLEQLPPEAIQQLLKDTFKSIDRIPDTLIPLLHERARGNPLFIEEMLTLFFDSQVFEPNENGGWKVNRLTYETMISTLPNSLIAMVQARLDDLPPVSRQMLLVAAVVGNTFWDGVLANITEMAPDSILDDLVERMMLVKDRESNLEHTTQYHFRHPLYRDVAYEMLPRAKRTRYHRKVAAWLESHTDNRRVYLPLLAEQYESGEQPERAMAFYLAAAEDRLGRGLLDESLNFTDQGLALAGGIPREEALPWVSRLWVVRAQCYNSLNRFEEASAASQSALRLFTELPDDELVDERVMAYRMLGLAYRSLGRYTDALDNLQQAYERVNPDNKWQLAAVLRSFGSLFLVRGRLDESLAYQQRAYQYAQEAGDQTHLTASMTQLGLIAYERGNLGNALNYFTSVLDINRQRENTHYQVLDLRNIGIVYQALFAYGKARAVFEEAAAIQQTIQYDDPLLEAHHALILITQGQNEIGLRRLLDAAASENQEAHTAFWLRYRLVEGLALLGDYVHCREQTQTFLKMSEAYNPIFYGRALLWDGVAAHALGDPQAGAILREALAVELTHGGLEVWRCYHALALSTTSPEAAHFYYDQAAQVLKALNSSLYVYPELQTSLLGNDLVKAIFKSAEDAD